MLLIGQMAQENSTLSLQSADPSPTPTDNSSGTSTWTIIGVVVLAGIGAWGHHHHKKRGGHGGYSRHH